jgi:hypothetical protein
MMKKSETTQKNLGIKYKLNQCLESSFMHMIIFFLSFLVLTSMKTTCIPSSTLNEIHIPLNSNFIKLNLQLIQLSSNSIEKKKWDAKLVQKGIVNVLETMMLEKINLKKKTLISNINSKIHLTIPL